MAYLQLCQITTLHDVSYPSVIQFCCALECLALNVDTLECCLMVFLGTFVCNCVQLPMRIVCKILKRDSLGLEREYFVCQITIK